MHVFLSFGVHINKEKAKRFVRWVVYQDISVPDFLVDRCRKGEGGTKLSILN